MLLTSFYLKKFKNCQLLLFLFFFLGFEKPCLELSFCSFKMIILKQNATNSSKNYETWNIWSTEFDTQSYLLGEWRQCACTIAVKEITQIIMLRCVLLRSVWLCMCCWVVLFCCFAVLYSVVLSWAELFLSTVVFSGLAVLFFCFLLLLCVINFFKW